MKVAAQGPLTGRSVFAHAGLLGAPSGMGSSGAGWRFKNGSGCLWGAPAKAWRVRAGLVETVPRFT